MATISIKIKNNKLDITLDYILRFHGKTYESTIITAGVSSPNPITKQQTVEALFEDQVRAIYQELDKASKVKTYANTLTIDDNIG